MHKTTPRSYGLKPGTTSHLMKPLIFLFALSVSAFADVTYSGLKNISIGTSFDGFENIFIGVNS